MSDTIAIGALRELTEHGIHVPDDVRSWDSTVSPSPPAPTHPSALWRWTSPQWLVRLSIAWVTLNESNLRHERPDDITHDHIQFQVMPRTSTLAA